MNLTQKKELIKYIDFHSRATSSSQNTINAIISSNNNNKELTEVFNLLKKEVMVVPYSGEIEADKFIENLAWSLSQGKAVLIKTDTLDFDPIVFDQLIQLRHKNTFTLRSTEGISISPTASIFLSYQGNNSNQKIWEIADHVIKMEELN